MSKTVEFFFDVGSPGAYLAWTQLPAICSAASARLVYRPMLLGGVFQATGNVSPVTVPAKGRYVTMEYQRYARRYGVALVMNAHFPINTLQLMRLVTGVQLRAPERLGELLAALFKAMWVDDLNLGDAQVAQQLLEAAGFAAPQVAALVNDAEVKAALRASTDEAVSRGVFGAPTMFVGAEMFFGQDKLGLVDEALAA